MGKVKGKHRLDKYYRLAKEHGYRSRAAWKLVQIDAKFRLLNSSHAVLDLCAAPGGWMQAAVERIPVGSLVVGIDLVPIAPLHGALSIQEDITKSECKAKIKKIMNEHGCRTFDLVLHDGSPNVGGAWTKDATGQNALVIDSVKLATQMLAPRGHFITKVFRSQDYSSVLYCLKQLFDKVEVFKPPASRSTSAEIFVIALRYKAPAKIDPRLLDMKHLFLDTTEPKKVVDVLRGSKQKRHRDGYDDGEIMFKKVCSATDFVWSDNALEILGSVTTISFEDPACSAIKEHILTTEEIKSLCEDLRVLGKQDFKQLLKWRMNIKKALTPVEEKVVSEVAEVVPQSKEDEDEKLLTEMEDMTNAMERQKKRAKKIVARRLAKDKARKATGVQLDAMIDGYTDKELFSLASIKGKKDLVAVDSAEFDDENDNMVDSDNEEPDEKAEDMASDIDSDEERQMYDDKMDDVFEQLYASYLAKKDGSSKQRKRIRDSYPKDGKLSEEVEEETTLPDYDSEKDHIDQEVNPLVVFEEREAPTQEQITNQWFGQEVFLQADEEGDLEKSESEDEVKVGATTKKTLQMPEKKKLKRDRQSKVTNRAKILNTKADDDFEVVPAPQTDSSSSDESDMDDDRKAEVLALSKKMIRKRTRNEMMDDAYNKYMFHDDGLPSWFEEDENKHNKPMRPVTKEEVLAMKAQFKDIDARPAKKAVQAKIRKQRVAHRRIEKVRKKANTISEQQDINELSKRKMIEQLYKKAQPKRAKKELVVAKKGVQVRTGKNKVLVDRRMKKDLRADKAAGKRGKGGGSKKGKNDKTKKGGGKGSTRGSAKTKAGGNRSKESSSNYKGRKPTGRRD